MIVKFIKIVLVRSSFGSILFIYLVFRVILKPDKHLTGNVENEVNKHVLNPDIY
jgi:hypothetical protein